jgi:hypothetical protein
MAWFPVEFINNWRGLVEAQIQGARNARTGVYQGARIPPGEQRGKLWMTSREFHDLGGGAAPGSKQQGAIEMMSTNTSFLLALLEAR